MSVGGALGKFIAADAEVGLAVKVYHRVNLALLGATPVALATSNSFLSFPVDMGLAIMFPLHGHIGMNYVITDYVPKLLSKAAVGSARAVMVGVTGFTMLGLTKLNIQGPGITGTPALWRSSNARQQFNTLRRRPVMMAPRASRHAMRRRLTPGPLSRGRRAIVNAWPRAPSESATTDATWSSSAASSTAAAAAATAASASVGV